MAAPDSLREARLLARNALARAGKLAFKPVSSAKWCDVQRSWTGNLYVRIEHDAVRGCTPAMMRWWFENIGRTTTWDGEGFDGPEVSFYHLWHHRDHEAIVPTSAESTGFTVGTYCRIMEQFNDFHEKIGVQTFTDVLDDQEFTFTVKKWGLSVVRIVHLYSIDDMGMRFYAETQVGVDIPVLGWLINWTVLPFIYSKSTAENWIRHNIEETGRSEDIIPLLYHHYNRTNNRRN
ncbi:unnamed protein product [Clonostachys rosea]|uniref:DAPG hydrolase PhiG domain-containing protein n=1 Tax=Bionectria ochroleuca TaxID=29856 RepID=A0ABY6UZX7_BIOOC|nr:unnamed protein product [Clonostachys rosea]